eukprot:4607975-Lingulodinium_polyedra.AAC.1
MPMSSGIPTPPQNHPENQPPSHQRLPAYRFWHTLSHALPRPPTPVSTIAPRNQWTTNGAMMHPTDQHTS